MKLVSFNVEIDVGYGIVIDRGVIDVRLWFGVEVVILCDVFVNGLVGFKVVVDSVVVDYSLD